jgi:hypothetical protein
MVIDPVIIVSAQSSLLEASALRLRAVNCALKYTQATDPKPEEATPPLGRKFPAVICRCLFFFPEQSATRLIAVNCTSRHTKAETLLGEEFYT